MGMIEQGKLHMMEIAAAQEVMKADDYAKIYAAKVAEKAALSPVELAVVDENGVTKEAALDTQIRDARNVVFAVKDELDKIKITILAETSVYVAGEDKDMDAAKLAIESKITDLGMPATAIIGE